MTMFILTKVRIFPQERNIRTLFLHQVTAFGIFALDIFDDSLHVASALWALSAALYSQRFAKMFLIVFGVLYLGDGIFGFLTGYGYLDLGIFTNDSEGLSFSLFRVLANLPHIALGGFALWSGLYLGHK